MNLLSVIAKVLLFTFCTAAVASARSLTEIIGDVIQNGGDGGVTPTNENVAAENVEVSRTKRQASNDCPVLQHLPVIVDGQETYLGFDENETRPPLFFGENTTISCPASSGSWWPAVEEHLSGLCPYKKVTLDMHNSPWEVYPRYITAAECICTHCITATAFGCQEIRRNFTFYRKLGCQGDLPVLEIGQVPITVGCFCQGARVMN